MHVIPHSAQRHGVVDEEGNARFLRKEKCRRRAVAFHHAEARIRDAAEGVLRKRRARQPTPTAGKISFEAGTLRLAA